MPLDRRTTRHFHRLLYVGWMDTLTLKTFRTFGNAGGAATESTYTVHHCRFKKQDHAGQQLRDGISSGEGSVVQITDFDLDNGGAPFPEMNDELIEATGERWLILSVRRQLGKNFFNCSVRRVD